ncbi:hypothetical protein [Allocoleopsis franciscana]|uniref:Uncharacterized protein n=1 Tax=Allocoleopsis franciscana PCC 7113 TaxID=1173027 RepID=K9W7C2_9CYAN|nr:hypothetical protein [Allocoleopsis franciscana]AFZ16285.1 hypothetical protein Mic7113_0363 [Allocoleopsis franciscana PCC 7113]
MTSICEIVQQALATGHLTVEAENQLRLLLQTTKYGLKELNAFMTLQESAMTGLVRQESRQLMDSLHLCAASSSSL